MADINARLIEATNGKAPQHKVEGENRFEATEGSDGRLHVKDKDLKAELESLKQTQKDIAGMLAMTNQQQVQILDRLNQPIDTQVTGSIVEYYPDVEIASGESFRTDILNVNFANTMIVILSDRGSNRIREELEMRVTFYGGEGRGLINYAEKIDQREGDASGYGAFTFDLLAPFARIELRNRTEYDGDNIQVNVYGVNK